MYHPVCMTATPDDQQDLDQMNAALKSQQMFSIEREQRQDCITLDLVEVEE